MKNQWMKKSCTVFVAMVSIFALCGCGSKAEDLQPHEWFFDGEIVSYYDSAETLDEESCQKYESYIDGAMSDSVNWVMSGEDAEIRCFCTRDDSVVTYKGICVGDEVSVVEDIFSYEQKIGECYNVYFDGTTEVDIEEHGGGDNIIILYYYVEAGIIEEIYVMDGVFGRTMR